MKAMMAAILLILLSANLSLLTAQESDVTPSRSSAALDTGNAPAGVDPTVSNTAAPGSAQRGPLPGPVGYCHDCHPHGCFLKKLLIWSTYCPKERICSTCQWCSSCQYKGVKPLHLFFQNPKCFEGCGVYPTFANECYRNSGNCDGCGHP